MTNKKILLAITSIVFICVIVLIQNSKNIYIYDTKVYGASMLPTLKNNESISIDTKVISINRKDIVIAISLNDNNKQVVKRVIGLPGDIIQIKNKTIYVNNVKLIEPYAKWKKESTVDIELHIPLKIPKDSYFLLGDNRDVSFDSRIYGPMPKSNIIGKMLVNGE